jgi:hypothetical protein
MIGSSLNPNHPLPMVRLKAFRGGRKTDLRRDGGRFTEIRIALQQLLKL